MKKAGLIGILVLLVGGGVLVTLGVMDPKTDLSSVLEMWGDELRDADQATLQVTRVSDAKEIQFGQEIRGHLPPDDPTWTPYVDAVGQSLVANVRRPGIRYQFHALASPQINAFAIPGGHVFVFTGMLSFLKSEAELAAILGHEISHVDLRHCIGRYQYELAARKIGLEGIGQVADLARLPITIGYQKNEELEADAQGLRLSIQAGYDPTAAAAVFSRMQAAFEGQSPGRAQTPEEELAKTLSSAMIDYFRSHPSSQARVQRLNELVASNQNRLRGKTVYVGVANYLQRTTMQQQHIAREERTF
jgi:predicted Zn-dependent protease